MGQCLSDGGAATEAAQAAAPPKATALVMLPTGELREYPRPATAARVLEDCCSAGEGWFLCDSDRMGFEGAVAAVGGAEPLRAGRIYFVLLAEALRRGLRREEVAELAVKASAALAKVAASASSGGGWRKRGSVAPLVFAPVEEEDEETALPARKAAAPAPAGKRRPAAGRPRRRFAPDLTAIPESEMSEQPDGMALFDRGSEDESKQGLASGAAPDTSNGGTRAGREHSGINQRIGVDDQVGVGTVTVAF